MFRGPKYQKGIIGFAAAGAMTGQKTTRTGVPTSIPQQDVVTIQLEASNSASYSGTGDTWSDLSGNGHDAVWAKGVSDCEALFTSGTSGYFDLDISSTTSDRGFAIADDVAIRPDGTGDWTVSYLVSPSSVTTTNDYVAFKSNNFAFLYGYYSTGRFSPFINANASWNDTFDELRAAEVDGWYLVTMRRDGSVIDGNINGNNNTNSATAAPTISNTSGSAWVLGGSNTNASILFPGRIAGFWFWNGLALTDTEIAAHNTYVSSKYTLSSSFV